MRLNKLEPSQKVKGRWLCRMDDGSILRIGENEVVSFALHSGMELDNDTLALLTSAAGITKVRDKALDLLTHRPHSRRELTKKLLERSVDPDTAEETADWLEHLGLLNDETYASTVVRHYSAKGYGPYKIKDELYRRGVPKAFWDSALSDVPAGTEQIDALVRQKLRGITPDRPALKRVSDALARRGYQWEEISAALRRYGADATED